MRGGAARRAILKPPGALLFQSGPESTGYHNRKISLPCSTFDRPTCRCASRVEDRSAREGSKKTPTEIKNSWKIGRFGCNSRQRLFCSGVRDVTSEAGRHSRHFYARPLRRRILGSDRPPRLAQRRFSDPTATGLALECSSPLVLGVPQTGRRPYTGTLCDLEGCWQYSYRFIVTDNYRLPPLLHYGARSATTVPSIVYV